MSGKEKTKELTDKEKRKIIFVHNHKDILLTELATKVCWQKVMLTTNEIEKALGNKFDDRLMSEVVLAMQFLVEHYLCDMLTEVNTERLQF